MKTWCVLAFSLATIAASAQQHEHPAAPLERLGTVTFTNSCNAAAQRLFGYSASEALQCATRIGGELMGLPVGTVKEGQLADLLVVDGNPLKDLGLFQDGGPNLSVIMKAGKFHKNTL